MVIFSFCFAQFHCTSNYYLNCKKETDYYKRIHREFENSTKNKTGILCETNGQFIIVKNVCASSDSTSFQVSDNYFNKCDSIDISWHQQNINKQFTYSNSQIKYIRFDSRWTGAIEGFLWGTASGLAMGNLVGRYYYAHEPYDEDPAPKEVVVGIFTIMGGIVGLPIGTFMGTIKKNKKYYYLNQKNNSTKSGSVK
jgi:hypothetical protein